MAKRDHVLRFNPRTGKELKQSCSIREVRSGFFSIECGKNASTASTLGDAVDQAVSMSARSASGRKVKPPNRQLTAGSKLKGRANALGWRQGDYIYCPMHGASNLTRFARVVRSTKARVFVNFCKQDVVTPTQEWGVSGWQTPGRCSEKEHMISPRAPDGWHSKMRCSWEKWNGKPLAYHPYLD